MDEDEDEDDENDDVTEIEEMIRNVNQSLDEELLGGLGIQGGSAGDSKNQSMVNHNMSIASFVNDMITRQDSPDLVGA